MGSLFSIYSMSLQWNPSGVPQELLWYMTAAFLLLALAYLSSVFYFRARIKHKTSRKAEIKKELAPMISKFLFFTEEDPLDARWEYVQLKIEIRELLKDRLTRTVLSEVLQDLKKDVSGSARKELLNLYSDLGLQEDALQRLKSRHWEVLSRSILELTEMEVQGAYSLIKKHINHRSSIVRKQAQIATVSLKSEGISYFLDTNRYPISEWQQLKLLDVIRHLEGFEAPKFKNWLTSKNTYVVLFALRLIKYYKQNDAGKAIIRLVNHRNQQIKIEAIQCIREFFIQEAKEPLKKAFPKGNEEVKLLILDTLGLIGDINDIEFLQNIANKGVTHIISSKTLSVINTLKPETIMPEAGIESIEEASTNVIEDKPQSMENKEEEVSVHFPKPNFQESPELWKDLLNPDLEDELIFSHCCLEEFRELIQEIGEPLLQAGDPGTLPLDFLPIVKSETVEQTKETAETMDQPTENKTNTTRSKGYTKHAEERITKEIESLLDFDSEDKPEFHEVEDVFNLNFLPILVDDSSTIAEEEDKEELDFLAIEVIAETLKYQVPTAFEKTSKASENYSLHVPPEESFEAIKAINWSAIARQNLELALPEQEETNTDETEEAEETPYGFSIFQELFRTADTESKLILLDEVLAIGDEKELHFLKTLSEDPSAPVRKKAALIQAALASQIIPEQESNQSIELNEISIANEKDSDVLFELSFEPQENCFQQIEGKAVQSETQQPEADLEDANNTGSVLGRFVALTHKIFEKIYG